MSTTAGIRHVSSDFRRLLPLAGVAAALLLAGCSVKKLAVRTLADALSESTSVYASDDDPELVGQALPFALKTLEGLLESDPENTELLLGTCKGFTQYAYGFAELKAERLQPTDYEEARRQSDRALRLYLRARDYCLRALDVRHPGIDVALRQRPKDAVATAGEDDVQYLYWTAASWGAAIKVGTHRPDLLIDLPAVRFLVERLLELDPDYDRGAVQEAAMLLYSLPANMGGDPEKARAYRDRALEMNDGQRASTYVSFAMSVSVPRQDREEFRTMLETALAIDADAIPSERLANVLSQRRARLLLDRIDELFLPPLDESGADSESDTETSSVPEA